MIGCMIEWMGRQGQRFRMAVLVGTATAATVLVVLAIVGVRVQPLNAVLVLLLLTLVVSANFGVRAGLLAAVLSNVALVYFFIDPVFKFWIYDPQHEVALLVFLLVSTIGGSLLESSRAHAEEAGRSQAHAEALLELNRAISGQADPEALLNIVCRQAVSALAATGAAILVNEAGRWSVVAFHGGRDADREPSQVEFSLAGQGATTDESKRVDGGRNMAVAVQEDETLVPLAVAGRNLGVLRIDSPTGGSEALMVAFGREAALAMSRREAEQQAASAEALRQTDEMKTVLISSISHDLKTPLAAIREAASSLLDEGVAWPDDDRQAFLHVINDQSDRLSTTIGDLLDLNRLETGSVRPLLADESTAQLMEDALAIAMPRLKGRRVSMDVPDVRITTDGSLMRHALANLVVNAGTHSSPEGRIRLSGSADQESVCFVVEDEGPGIDPAERDLIFTPFFKGGVGKGKSKGSGLGLAIVKGFVSLCSGTIAVDSNPDGTRFVVTLPRISIQEGAK